jgi:hypothetical protein
MKKKKKRRKEKKMKNYIPGTAWVLILLPLLVIGIMPQ